MAERKKLEVTILPQNFTETQQEQARKNISAAPMSDVSSLSAKTVTKINGDECLSVTTARNPDGTIEYSLSVTAQPTDTRIQGKDGVYASRVSGDEGLWTVGLSGKYLSANALNNLSGNWQGTYNTVNSNSAKWNEASAFSANSGIFAIKTDVNNEFNATSAWAKQTFASASQLADYYKKTETSGAEELETAFNKKQDKLTTGQLSAISSVSSIKSDLATHVEDTDVHIQDGERNKWNKVDDKVDTTAFDQYKTEVEREFTNTSAWANEKFQPIGNYLSANALNDLSGYWDSVYNSVLTNSASWNETSATLKANSGKWDSVYDSVLANSASWNETSATLKANSGYWNNHSALSATKLDESVFETWKTDEFGPVKTDVNTLKANSAHYPVESTNQYITVNSADHKFALTFVSGDLATKEWVEAQLGDFGGYVPCEATGTDKHPNVDNPDPKKMYLVPKEDATEPDRYYNWIVTGDETTGWLCIGDTSMDLTPYLKISDISGVSGNWNTAYGYVTANSANIAEASATAIDVNNTVNTYSSNWQESYNTLTSTSANWDSVYDTVNDNSATWNDTNTTLSDNSGKWEESYEALTSTSADWNKTYTYITANSANIESVSSTVNANSGKWNEASAFSANSGKFVTSGDEIEDTDLVYVLKKTGDNVAWSGIDLSNLGKIYPITSITPDLVSATISAVDDIPTYVLSAKEPDPVIQYSVSASMMSAWTGVNDDINYYFFSGANISGNNGISAEYNSENNQWDIGLRKPSYNYVETNTIATTTTAASETISGYTNTTIIGSDITVSTNTITLPTGLYHVDIQVNVPVETVSNTYADVVLTPNLTTTELKKTVDFSYAHIETLDLSFDVRILAASNGLSFTIAGLPVGSTYQVKNLQIHEVTTIDTITSIAGGIYAGGEAINIDSQDKINVLYDAEQGLTLVNNKLAIKLGEGLKFDTSGAAAGSLSLSNIAQEVVETVDKMTNDLDEKVTVSMPFNSIVGRGVPTDFQTGKNRMIGQLFSVAINNDLRVGDTVIEVFGTDTPYTQSNPIFGLYEYDFDYPRYDEQTQEITGYGRTLWVCDTGPVTCTTGKMQFPITHLNPECSELKASRVYYATIAIAGNAGAGPQLAGCGGYGQTFNANPVFTTDAQDITTVDFTDASGTLSGTGFWQNSYHEEPAAYRFFMQIRNKKRT